MKVLLVANDRGPAEALARIAVEAVRRNLRSVAFLFNCAETVYDFQGFEKMDALLVGMASGKDLAKSEIFACQRMLECGKPVYLFADTFGVWRGRNWFNEIKRQAKMLFVLNQQEKQEAEESGQYPVAQIVAAGNPCWESFFFPRTTRDEVRKYLGVGDGRIVLVPGGKDFLVNKLHFNAALAALNLNGYSDTVVFALHPGDRNELAAYRSELISTKAKVIMAKSFSPYTTDDLLIGADVVIPSASGVGIAAACMRKPVINYFSLPALEGLEQATGSQEWPPVKMGVELEAHSTVELAQLISACFSGEEMIVELKKKQKEVYPRPERGCALAIVESILK